MGPTDRRQFAELMDQADSMGPGPTQLALLEAATRLADLLADAQLGFQARTKLVEAGTFSGAPEKAMVAFSWCLAQLDRDPESYPEWKILWQYKWVVNALPVFPQVTGEQIRGALDDLARRLGRSGYGTRPVEKLRFRVARTMGDAQGFHASHATWLDTPRGSMSDCPACDLDEEVGYLADSGQDERAIARARPIIEGKSRCRTVPHTTMARLLAPLLRTGRGDEAAALHLKGYRLILRNRDFLEEVGRHVEYLALAGNLAKGIKLFQSHLPWALETFDGYDRFVFSTSSLLLLDLLKASGKDSVRLRLPSTFPIFEESGRYSTEALAGWLDSDAADMARRFDARNGNDWFARSLEEGRGRQAPVIPFPPRGPGPGESGRES
jgi:hypothetical protein